MKLKVKLNHVLSFDVAIYAVFLSLYVALSVSWFEQGAWGIGTFVGVAAEVMAYLLYRACNRYLDTRRPIPRVPQGATL